MGNSMVYLKYKDCEYYKQDVCANIIQEVRCIKIIQ